MSKNAQRSRQLGFGDAGEQLGAHPGYEIVADIESSAPFGFQGYHVGAPIIEHGVTGNQAFLLERIQQPDECWALDAKTLRQMRLDNAALSISDYE